METRDQLSEEVAEVDQDNDYDDIPLQHKRPFGAGLHRNPVSFVPASDGQQLLDTTATHTTTKRSQPSNSSHDISDLYLSLVLPDDAKPKATTPDPVKICEICRLPLDNTTTSGEGDDRGTQSEPEPSTSNTSKKPRVMRVMKHESSLAHQLCLPHSHPPSALDRSRMGLSYLSTYGWDPDSRRGLGAEQQGIQYPIKPRPKENNLGLGLHVTKEDLMREQKRKEEKKKAGQKLDAGKVRKMVKKDRERAERLRQELFGRVDLEKYLGPGAG
ncbi:G-patch domain-protein [Diplogelasinospora grovesii]|uniref:G-patch domain-protein n=1 Tax=Diplogelasinospora grovesii TaxID=303347 RepID=A0AAN6S806_9PEZI|nr:G-patch domain-protein [Diplogelasinospora grovesii]